MADVRAVDAADWAGVVQDALAQVAADDILRALTSDPLTAPFAVDRIVECVQSAITDEQVSIYRLAPVSSTYLPGPVV